MAEQEMDAMTRAGKQMASCFGGGYVVGDDERIARQAAERRAEAAEARLAELIAAAKVAFDAMNDAYYGISRSLDYEKVAGFEAAIAKAEREPATPPADAAGAEGGEVCEQITPDDFDGMIDVANDPESAVGRLRTETRRIPMREDTDQ